MPVFVIEDAGVVGRVRSITTSGELHESTVLEEFAAGTEMNLSLGGQRLIFPDVVLSTRQAIVSSLKRMPPSAAAQAVANSVNLRRCMVSVHHHRDTRERWSLQLKQQVIDVRRHAVDVIVSVDLSEMGGLNVPPKNIGFGDQNLVNPPAATSRFK